MNNEFKYESKDLVNYLKNPLKFKSTLIFGNNYDDEEELNTEFESFKVDSLLMSKIMKSLLLDLIKKGIKNEQEIHDEKYILELKHKLNISNRLPKTSNNKDDKLEKYSFDTVLKGALEFINYFKEIANRYPTQDDILNLDEIKINNKVIIPSIENSLVFNVDGKIIFMELSKLEYEPELIKFYKVYVDSLLYIVSKKEDIHYDVLLIKGLKKGCKEFNISTSEARGILESIIDNIEDEFYRFIPVNIINSQYKAIYENKEENLYNRFKLLEEKNSNDHSTWTYFKDRKLFNDSDIGYSIKNFKEEYKEALEKYIELIEPLLKIVPKEKE